MANHGLTAKEKLHGTIKLVTFFKILAHIQISERDELFKELSEVFKKQDKKYEEVLTYYQNNWLKAYYVESMRLNEEEEDFSLIARTNNVCEYYNYMLNQKMKITNPRLSILISNLLQEELNLREYVMKSIVNMLVEPPTESNDNRESQEEESGSEIMDESYFSMVRAVLEEEKDDFEDLIVEINPQCDPISAKTSKRKFDILLSANKNENLLQPIIRSSSTKMYINTRYFFFSF